MEDSDTVNGNLRTKLALNIMRDMSPLLINKQTDCSEICTLALNILEITSGLDSKESSGN